MVTPSLRIGVPVYDSLPAETFASMLGISEFGSWSVVRGTYIEKARNDIMEQFEEDLLLMVDSDMVFEPAQAQQLLKRLVGNRSHGALSGHYIMRDGTGLPVCDWKDTEDKTKWMSDEARMKKAARLTRSGGVHRVDSFGGGFLAITQEAKRKLGRPWFRDLSHERDGHQMGEDTYFCQRLIKEGFKPAVHFGIQVGHCGKAVYRP